jgi:hypothetical protein
MLDLFDPEDEDDVPPKRQFILNGLHAVIPQTIVHFIPFSVKVSVPAHYHVLQGCDYRERVRIGEWIY